MTNEELIKSLKNYARAYSSGNPYDFNPGVAIMVANRIEELAAENKRLSMINIIKEDK